MQITTEDFDNAVKQKWNGTKCLIAQAMIREGVDVRGALHVMGFTDVDSEADRARKIFDCEFHNPGDENKPELQALRASLPITI